MFIQSDGRNTDLEDNSFDVVHSNATIEHVGTSDDQINFLKECVKRNSLSKKSFVHLDIHKKLCDALKIYQVGDPSHKNIMIEGICHFQFHTQNIIEI
jgi:ubiquinone/menaquinone biosynthesis C-methylase UbiE